MTEPTAEALAWLERAKSVQADGVTWGVREICPDCLRPIGWEWWALPKPIPACGCGTVLSVEAAFAHGLEGIDSDSQTGTITYG